ncbi:helix-turn-helix transcriptional regulator [Pelagibacterium halotolerans]|uniref:helix-turn-helix transcriptional regulator n=1 Tax=Pelagibacterium halotolerans TaxID=531813 RepID=UPI0038500219
MCGDDDLFRTEFYNDWVVPQENLAVGGGALLFKDEKRTVAFGGNMRLKDADKLQRTWLQTVSFLTPHLQQAFEIARVLASQSLERDLLHKGDMSGETALLLVADNGFVLHANDVAAGMLSSGSVLRNSHNGRMSFADSHAEAMLEHCLSKLRAGHPGVSATFPARTMRLAAYPDGYTVRAIAFDPTMHNVSPFPLTLGYVGQSLLVTITRAEPESSDLQALATEHGLTAAETKIVLGIAEGKTQAELAHERSVSIHTVRNQLKSAMSKMSVRRQADIVRVVGRLKS